MASKLKVLERIYDKLYVEAEAILNEFKPCEHKVIDNENSCVGKLSKLGGCQNGCCGGCPFFKNGCTAEKPLSCKVWICFAVMSKYPLVRDKLDKIKDEVIAFNFYIYRADKTVSMERAGKYINNFTLKYLNNYLTNNF